MLACHNTDMEASDNKMADGFMTLPEVIQTPCGPFNGVTAPDGHTICAVDRSGALVMNLLPSRKMSKAKISKVRQSHSDWRVNIVCSCGGHCSFWWYSAGSSEESLARPEDAWLSLWCLHVVHHSSLPRARAHQTAAQCCPFAKGRLFALVLPAADVLCTDSLEALTAAGNHVGLVGVSFFQQVCPEFFCQSKFLQIQAAPLNWLRTAKILIQRDEEMTI